MIDTTTLAVIFAANSFIPATYVRAYDADTITVTLACKIDVFCKNIGVRLKGIDTPELRTKDRCEKKLAVKARDFVRAELFGKTVQLHNVTRGKYFRLVADVKYKDKDLKRELFKHHYGVPYEGKKKMSVDWCLFLKEHR